MVKHYRWTSLAVAVLAGAAAGQVGHKGQRATAATFLEKHGKGWVVAPSGITQEPTFVYGSKLTTPYLPRTEAEFDLAARWVVDDNKELFGFDAKSLKHEKTHLMRLPGSSNKWFVKYQQMVGDVPVLNGKVSILFSDLDRQVIGLDNAGVPFADQVSTTPQVSQLEAIEIAKEAYRLEFGVPGTDVDSVDVYVVGPGGFFGLDSPLNTMGPTLAYVIHLSTADYRDERGLPVAANVFVSAESDRTVIKVQPTIYTFQEINGSVTGFVNTGEEPSMAGNMEQPGLANLWVKQFGPFGPVLTSTDAAGGFTIPVPGPIPLYFALRGDFFNVLHDTGAESSITMTGSDAAPVDIVFNMSGTEQTTAEVAGAYWVNELRDFIKAVDPTDTTMDFSVTTNVNLNSCCNAFYDGVSINMYLSGCGCPNTAYSSVINHEEGHWANELYNGFVSGAFHEGVADAWSEYVFNTHCLGFDFFGPGQGCLRDGEQTSINKCPVDCNETCHGGAVHTEGQAIAAAMWKARRNVNNAIGDVAARAVMDAIFVGWFQAFNDTSICNVIADHWIMLDDDNGHLGDGTPHFAEIDGGFQEQGWPGVVLPDTSGTFVQFGGGCPGTGGLVPALSGTGTPSGGNPVTISVSNGLPGGIGFLFFSAGSGPFTYGGSCPLWLAPPFFKLATVHLDGTGSISLGGTLDPAFPADVHTYFQYLGFDTAAPANLSASNGLDMHSN